MAFGTKKDKDREVRGGKAPQSRMNQADDEPLEGFTQEADAYDVPPPVADGEHIVEVKIAEGKEHGEFEYEGRKHFHLPLVLTLIGKSDPDKGRFVFDYPNTMPRTTAKGVTTAIATLVRRFGGKASGRPFTDLQALKSILTKSTPKAKIVTRWEADYDKDVKKEYKDAHNGESLKPYKKGQSNFPEVDGVNVPLTVDNEGRALMTSARVLKYEAVD